MATYLSHSDCSKSWFERDPVCPENSRLAHWRILNVLIDHGPLENLKIKNKCWPQIRFILTTTSFYIIVFTILL